ncbi:hypothetical protein A2774_00880 [Candidatus Roizmanbacteria bacterium RIFCSPHIGHO2_01_FULL_39_12c]|uniref:Glycosyltransferase RgtA/B/C/D-like domain-containing protein n=1 Tax=Candidatus Roizmanbacteria bacterium RIFCSPHIGHO2_01_FULL_39_12c TaxID=1802031 RepID=A0A1F7GF26_9BACT|nr:MAG: hypothetical protein A2774_00880 [Candidatus Roizmanbacteria bacterium RIFCSPHIGHO2_01_FULL_39_12c]OGK46546.1 MAG: hypothetical protein A2963_02295 [Candidatus Roizmanbacteria bacterium RIFCSPLOWO2_01_FULL_40_13]
MKYKITLIFLAAFLIRLIAINQSLWLDEATTARVVQRYNYWEIITKFSPHDFHPPLYYMLMKLWTNIFGYAEVVLRLPSVLFSLATGYMVYLLGKKIGDNDPAIGGMAKREVGIRAAVFFLFNPLIVYYSQEARMYMMTTFFLSISIFYLILMLKEKKSQIQKSKFKAQNLVLFTLFSVLSFLTFYGSVFLTASMLFYLLFKKKFRMFYVSCLMFGVACLLLSPLLYRQLMNAKQQLQLVADWSQVLGSANLKNLLLIPLKFSIGRISFKPKWIYWFAAGVWSIITWFNVVKGGIKQKLLLYLLMTPIGLGFIFSFWTPLLQYFRFIYLIPIMSILLVSGMNASINRLIKAGFMVFTLIYLLVPAFYREDWKSLANAIKSDEVYMIYSSSDPLQYYRGDIRTVDLNELSSMRLSDKEIYLIPYSADIHRIDYRAILAKKNFRQQGQIDFRGLKLEKWKRYSAM